MKRLPLSVSSTSKLKLAIIFILLLVATTIAGARTWLVKTVSSTGQTTATQATDEAAQDAANTLKATDDAQTPSSADSLQVELVTLRPEGFEPSEITRSKGRFILALNNRSNIDELTLQLENVGKNKLVGVKMPKGRMRWVTTLNLPAGDYVLSAVEHPEISFRLSLTQQ